MSTSPRKRPASEALVAGGVVILLIAIVGLVFWSGAGSSLYPPQPATAQAQEISDLYDIIFALAVAIFVAVEGLIVWSILRYRRRPEDVDLPPQTHGNNLVEALWTVIPTVIVLYLFVISWDTLSEVDAVSAAAGRPDPRPRRPVPVAVRVPRRDGADHVATADRGHGRRRAAAWPSRSARRST